MSSRSSRKAPPRSAGSCCRSRAHCCSRSSRREGHVQPVAIRYRTPDGDHSRAPAYVGDTSFVESFWCVCGERALTVELVARPALPARDRHRRDLARLAEASIRTALVVPASAREPDTASGPGNRTPVSVPPHTQPESSISTFGASMSSSVDQCPQTTVAPAVRRFGCGKPRLESCRSAFEPALLVQFHRVVGRAEAQPRACVDGDAQAIESREIVAPLPRLVPVQHAQEFMCADRSRASPALRATA